MKKILSLSLVLLLISGTAQAQLFKKLGDAAKKAAENAVTRQTEKRTEDAVNKTIDGVFDGNDDSSNNSKNNNNDYQEPEQQSDNTNNAASVISANTPKAAEMAYAKSDFVPGDEIIFDDNLVGEQLGEFPSQWDLLGGNAEISKVDGTNAIYFDQSTTLAPLMKNTKSYLTDSYTIEFDFYVSKDVKGWWRIELMGEDGNRKSNIELWSEPDANRTIEGSWTTTTGEHRTSSSKADLSAEGWHRISISFNKRALKVYFDGLRTMNVPNVIQANWFRIFATQKHYIKDIYIFFRRWR